MTSRRVYPPRPGLPASPGGLGIFLSPSSESSEASDSESEESELSDDSERWEALSGGRLWNRIMPLDFGVGGTEW